MTQFDDLLAKSIDPAAPKKAHLYLSGHTAMVHAACEILLAERGDTTLSALGLPLSLRPRLNLIVKVAALIHDLGKCTDHFQQMVRGHRDEPQLLRHEAATLFLVWPGQPLASWLMSAFPADTAKTDLMLAAVAGASHHRKFSAKALAADDRGAGPRITLLAGHPKFIDTLSVTQHELKLGPPPQLQDITLRRLVIDRQLKQWSAHFTQLERSPELLGLFSAAKALLICADVAGSALPKGTRADRLAHPEEHTPTWITEALTARATADRLEAIATDRLTPAGGGVPYPPRPFQEATAASDAPITFVRAGCGSGKTVAAYLWAARQHPGRQLWLTYPTTGTATEGYRDYVHDADISGHLEHSRRTIDIEHFDLHEAHDHERDDTQANANEKNRPRDRLESIRIWSKEVVVCTVDTALGLIQSQRKGMYAWPGLCDSAVVFDEIHAYDDRLFDNLCHWLSHLPGVPALLMTASLPTHRLERLRRISVATHGRPLCEIEGPADLEQLPRYQRHTTTSTWQAVQSCLNRGGKVLWVSNTVDTCRQRAIEVQARDLNPQVYHSRFRYIDRVARHSDVINAFKGDGPALAMTTQVAEMSLDLSADLLVTDLAPIPALIQRLGRLNRRARSAADPVKDFIVLDPRAASYGAQQPAPQWSPESQPTGKPEDRFGPYLRGTLDAASEWLRSLGDGHISQRDLITAWAAHPQPHSPNDPEHFTSTWLTQSADSLPNELRESTSHSIDVVLADDVAAIESGQELGQYVIPIVPLDTKDEGSDWHLWPTVKRYTPIAPADQIIYCPQMGAHWSK